MRETETSSMTLPPMRARRGRSLIERFRQGARGPGEAGVSSRSDAQPEKPYDLFGTGSAGADLPGDERPEQGMEPAPPPSSLEQALAVFNASEFPRRVAGVARSLGAPVVNVRSAEHHASVVNVVVAWELSWYRYEIDLSETPTTAKSKTQGTELDELEHDELEGNAVVLESGLIALAQ
jgi:hypothetical protein